MRQLPLLSLLVGVACGAPREDAPADSDSPAPFHCAVPDALTPDPRLVRWPYLTSVTTTGAVVQWGLPVGTTGLLEWGPSDDFGEVTEPDVAPVDALVDPIGLHAATLDGLRPDTPYCYRIAVDGEDLTGPLAFRTPPPNDTDRTVRFLVLGDYGNGSAEAAAVRDRILERAGEFDFWIATGDNAYSDGTYAEWDQNVFAFYRDLLRRVPYFPVPGNHDYRTGTMQPMMDNLALPRMAYREEDQERYYAFDWGPLHFSMLDSQQAVYQSTPDEGDDQLDFYQDVLAAAAGRPWRIGVWHHPAYVTQPGRTGDVAALLQLVPAAEAGGTQLVLQGHNHNYERFSRMKDGEKVGEGGTTYVTSGGGGAGLYPVTPDDGEHRLLPLRDRGLSIHHFMLFEADRCRITGRAIDLEGQEFDRFELTRCGSR